MCAAAYDWFQDFRSLAPDHQGIVFTQLPARAREFGEGARIVRMGSDRKVEVLTQGFASAADPEVSFDGKRLIFAARRESGDHWQIYEMQSDGSDVRRISDLSTADCRNPIYQSQFYNIMFDRPWRQVAFVREDGQSRDLYSTKLDGSLLRRLTYNLAANYEPVMMPDGRIVFPAALGTRSALFGVNLDGTDYSIYSSYSGAPVKRSPAVTEKGLAIFVESSPDAWDGAGALGAISLKRSLHSYRALTKPGDGLFAWPSGLPGGDVLVSRRTANGVHGIYRLEPESGRMLAVYTSPEWHNVQARLLAPRTEPDGRASVVDEKEATGRLYCLSANTSDTPEIAGLGRRLRLIDGSADVPGTRLIGETAIEADGSFNVEVPANTPMKVQVLDSDGVALRTSEWIWVKNKENRGCIGCHEDGELTPENRMADALTHASAQLTLPPARRRTVDYKRDVQPLLSQKCGTGNCHPNGLGRYIRPGEARNSPLAWSLYGRGLSRPWDKAAPGGGRIRRMPPAGHPKLSDDDKRAIVEWIDMGAVGVKEKNHDSTMRTATRR